jgi:1-aminocyclopropane-1-carboxylate deaminase
MQIESPNIPLQPVNDTITKNTGIHLFVLRTDLNHPHISGNKLFKLKYNLIEAKKQEKKTLLTFGGAFSNHIAATAASGKEYGFKTIGIIRGDKHQELNPTLKFATNCRMHLHYVSRTLYQNKKELYQYINQQFSKHNFYLIPEGGSNEAGVLGCKEIIKNIPVNFDHICCPCGTGATLSGILLSLKKNQKVIGFQVLKAENYIQHEVTKWLTNFNHSLQNNWIINEDHHFGGYAKIKPELIDFIDRFEKENNIPLDKIYTGKMMFGIYHLIESGYFKKGEIIIAIHTGGLQGNAGFLNK